MTRQYDALVLDIDGTLVDEQSMIRPSTRSAIARARASGVVVMLATGRSSWGTREIVDQLELDAPSIVINGAGLYDRREDRLIEHFALPEPMVTNLIAFAEREQLFPLVSSTSGQYARPLVGAEAAIISDIRNLRFVQVDQLPRRDVTRVTLFSLTHDSSAKLHEDVRRAAGDYAAYYTHFPLAALAHFRASTAQVVDAQPDCKGKAEALRVLHSRYGIPAERVVAVGDANNDLTILRAAGLGVAMGNATPEAKAAAKRVIGDNDSDALAGLIDELFLAGPIPSIGS
jgi:5-amino-6-(5-phospho-D-ribitylamino)uracil phosphatase